MTKKGFTLVELLAVIAILSVLILLIVPSITNVTKSNKKVLLEAKIKTIEKAGEKYGNSNINDYQNCINGTTEETLKSKCIVDISKLINSGYMEGDNKSSQIIDPVSNDALSGNVLLCYDPYNVNIYASYIDNDTYSCKAISLNSTNTMNLSSVGKTSYIGGNQISINILSSGSFNYFGCTSNLPNIATCSVDNSSHKLNITPAKTTNENFESKEVIITVYGEYNNSDNTTSTLSKTFTLKVYPTSMYIDESKNNVCLETGKTENVNITGENIGPIEIKTDNKNILYGTTKNNVLYVTAGNVTGEGKLTLTEKNGNNTINFVNHVYNLSVSGMPDDIVVGKEVEVTVNYSGTGSITVTRNSDALYFSNYAKDQKSITLKNGENSFKIIGNNIGQAELTIKGSYCGEYKQTIYITNLIVEERKNNIVYINGSSIKYNVITEDNNLSCYSLNENAASCSIDGTSVEILPGFEESDNTVIIVQNKSGGQGTIRVKTLRTSINIVDDNDNPVQTVCLSKSNINSTSKVYVKGQNMGSVTLPDFDDYFYLSLSEIRTNNGKTEVILTPQNIPVDQAIPPYNPGYNTGRSIIKVKESNGNQITTFNYNIYTMNYNSSNNVVNVGSILPIEIFSSATGDISATSSNEEIASIDSIDNDIYNWEVNAQNKAIVNVKGNKVGNATITITGADCGKLTYYVEVKGNELKIKLEKGTYTNSIVFSELSCTTQLSDDYCDVTFPQIYPKNNFTSSGYSTIKDSSIAMYKPGDTFRITSDNSGETVFYGNSIDNTKPVCTFENAVDQVYLNQETDLIVNCTDVASGINSNATLSADNFTISNPNIAEIVSVSAPTSITNGYSYTVKLQGLSYGTFTVTLNEDSIHDAFNLGNASATSSSISSFEYTPIKVWYIGAVSRTDVMAVLYSNSDYLSLDDGNYTLKIYGSGEMLNFTSSTSNGGGWKYSPWYNNYRSKITNVVVEEKITNIGNYSFYNSSNLTNVVLPDTIDTINDYAFYKNSLTELILPKMISKIGEYAFAYNNIKKLFVPNSLKIINEYAFYYVPLESLNFESGSKLKTIGNYAFNGKHNLSSIVIPASVESIGSYAFVSSYEKDGYHYYSTRMLKSLTFEEGSNLKTIGHSAFEENSLKSLTIPASVESIGRHAFLQVDTDRMTNLNFDKGSNLKIIDDGAFNGIVVSSLSLPDSLTKIGQYAFGYDTNISTIKIGPNVSSIGQEFLSSIYFYEITVDDNNQFFTSYRNVLYSKDLTHLIRCPDAYYLYNRIIDTPRELTTFVEGSFGGWGFWDNGSIQINLYENFETFNAEFNQLSSVNYFNITNNPIYKSESGFIYSKNGEILYAMPGAYPNSSYRVLDNTTTIAAGAGYGNITIRTITLPSSVSVIEDYAFFPLYGGVLYDLAFNVININSSNTLSFTYSSFAFPYYLYYNPTRTINVSNKELKDRIASEYTESGYIINYVGG